MKQMKIFDISQEVFGCQVYPGDRTPKQIVEKRMSQGELYNLSSFEMCAHNGTHMDAPFHFIADGKTIDTIPLDKMIGWCVVIEQNGEIGEKEAKHILLKAHQLRKEAAEKILLKGNAIVLEAAAEVFSKNNLDLIGVELLSVGPEAEPANVHQLLLKEEICLLEGIRLQDVEEGVYFLHAAPLALGGFDGAPCRATLIQF